MIEYNGALYVFADEVLRLLQEENTDIRNKPFMEPSGYAVFRDNKPYRFVFGDTFWLLWHHGHIRELWTVATNNGNLKEAAYELARGKS